MATRIIEYGSAPEATIGPYSVVPSRFKIGSQSAITATGTSAQSSAFDSRTRIVCVDSDEAVYVNFGTNPTATTDDYRVKAGSEQFFEVAHGESWKVAVRT